MELNDDVIAYGVKCAMTGANNVLDALLYDDTIETTAKRFNPDAWSMTPSAYVVEHGKPEAYQYSTDEEVIEKAKNEARSEAHGLLGVLYLELR